MPKKTQTATALADAPAPETFNISRDELQALIASEVAKASVRASGTTDVKLAEAIDALSANQKTIVEQVQAKNRTVADMMKEDPKISAFNPKGDRDFPRPTHFRKVNGVPRRVFFCGIEQSPYLDRMTMEEIAAFDAFTENCECRNKTWKAEVYQNGTAEELRVYLPTGDIDRKQEIGAIGLTNILYELRTKGKIRPDATNILNKMLATATDPDAFIANLERLLAQPVSA